MALNMPLSELGNSEKMRLAKNIMKKLKRMAINMFCLLLGIAD